MNKKNIDAINIKKLECSNESISQFIHELTQPLIVINTYINACIHRLQENKIDHPQLLEMMINIKNHSFMLGHIILEMVYKYLNQSSNATQKIIPQITLLTPREQEVMNLIIEGKYNKEIASDLNISISTVEAHRSSIMEKFQAKNLAHLFKLYYIGPSLDN